MFPHKETVSDSPDPKTLFAQPPFKSYDFFGILIPGVCFIVSAYLFEVVFARSRQSKGYHDLFFHWFRNEVQLSSQASAAEQTGLFVLAVIFIYITGHVVASISSFLLDRVLIYKGYGYPYEFLLFPSANPPKSQLASRRFYRGSTFWLNAWIMIWAIARIFWFERTELWMFFVVVFPPFLLLFMAYIVHKGYDESVAPSYSRQAIRSFFSGKRATIESILRTYVRPYDFFGLFVEGYIRTNQPLQEEIAVRYRKAFQERFGMSADTADSNNYWLSVFYVTKMDRRISDRVSEWYNVSGFARNLSTAFYLAYIYAVAALLFKSGSVPMKEEWTLFIATFCLLTLACVMAIRYYHCYVSYYSKGLFRAFVFLNMMDRAGEASNHN